MPLPCSNCGRINRDEARFCAFCSQPLSQAMSQAMSPQSGRLCSNCGHTLTPNARFCPQCGQSVEDAAPVPMPGPTTGPKLALADALTGNLQPATVLSERYEVEQLLGQGGMGAVYLATDQRLPGKKWAIKEMSDAAISDPQERSQAVQAFRQESQMLATLDHPNLPKVVDYFSELGNQYLVMEFVEGETLEGYLARQGGRLPEAEIVAFGLQLCHTLDYLHNRQPPIIFRDLKPANIIVSPGKQLKLIDFGIARHFKPGQGSDTQAMGTPGYASPEQYGKGQTDNRSDVYSLGVTLHTLATGYDPAHSPFALPPVRSRNPAISSALEQVIARATQVDVSQRFSGAAEMRAALSRASSAARGVPIAPQTNPNPAQPPILMRAAASSAAAARAAFTPLPPPQRFTVQGGAQSGENAAFGCLAAMVGTLAFGALSWLPTLGTFQLSFQQFDILRPRTFVGAANYVELLASPPVGIALQNTLVMMLVRGAVAFIVWQILVSSLRQGRRVPIWAALVSVAALPFFSPVGTAMIWRFIGRPELTLASGLVSWGDPFRALISLFLVDGLHTLAFAAAGGLALFALIDPGSPASHRTAKAVGVVMVIAAFASALQSFAWSHVTTGGGPANTTLTWVQHQYQVQFVRLQLGLGAAMAVPALLLLLILAFVLYRKIASSGLRLEPLDTGPNRPARSGAELVYTALVLALAPWIVLALPYFADIGSIFSGLGSGAAAEMPWARLHANSFVHIIVVWLAQIPIALLVGRGLISGGRGPALNWLTPAFMFSALTGTALIAGSLFLPLRNLGFINTMLGAVAPLVAGGPAAILFALAFLGMMRARAQGAAPGSTGGFWASIILFAAVFASLMAWQQLYWPLVMLNSQNSYTVSLGLYAAAAQFDLTNPVAAVRQVMLPFALIAAPLLVGTLAGVLRTARLTSG